MHLYGDNIKMQIGRIQRKLKEALKMEHLYVALNCWLGVFHPFEFLLKVIEMRGAPVDHIYPFTKQKQNFSLIENDKRSQNRNRVMIHTKVVTNTKAAMYCTALLLTICCGVNCICAGYVTCVVKDGISP